VKCDLPTLLALLHALDGSHGRVVEVSGPPDEPVDPTKPVAPKRKPEALRPDDEEPDDNEPGGDEGAEPGAAPDAAKERTPKKITIQLEGHPSTFSPDPEQGALKERFTIMRPDEKDEQGLAFVANAVVTKILGGGKVEAVIEPSSDICFTPEGKTTTTVVRPGDLASTRFFFVRSVEVKAVEGTTTRDKAGFPVEVTPPHLEVELSVGALRHVEPQQAAAVRPQPAAKRRTIHRGL
jgi:hypothetical protein